MTWNTSDRSTRIGTVLVMAFLVLATGCGDDGPPQQRSEIGGPVVDPHQTRQMSQLPEEAPCTIYVEGTGDVDIEEDYIPNVVACENGNAPMEALKAQAIQARGYIYYKIFVTGETSVVDSQADQVYSCDYATAEARHFEAARATRAEYLAWNEEVVAPFYVAGAIPANQGEGAPEDACHGAGGNDTTTTEQWVTYNAGKSGCDIDMTPLGWVPADCHGNPQNRGCASQNGQSCLADRGWDHRDMFPYYYGDDIEIHRAGGECGGPWIEPTEYDLYCGEQSDDDWSCYTNSERVLCADDEADTIEDCPHGCADGVCSDPPELEDQFCANDVDEDGWYCLDNTMRVHCQEGASAATENCTAGCEDHECVPTGQTPDNSGQQNNTPNNSQPNNDTANNSQPNNDTANNSQPDGDTPNNSQSNDGEGSDDAGSSEEPVSLLTPSPGIEGGCSQAASGSSAPASILITLVLLTFAAIRFDR